MKEIPPEDYDFGSDYEPCENPEIISRTIILELPFKPSYLKKLKAKVSSPDAVSVREKAKVIIERVSKLDNVSEIGIGSTRLSQQLPLEGIIHSICVAGDISNETFNKIILIRDEHSNFSELPIIPLNVMDYLGYELVWTSKTSN